MQVKNEGNLSIKYIRRALSILSTREYVGLLGAAGQVFFPSMVFILKGFNNKENFFPVQVLHLLVHHDRLPRDLLPRSLHPAHNQD